MFECQVYDHKKGRWKSFSMHIVCCIHKPHTMSKNAREDGIFFINENRRNFPLFICDVIDIRQTCVGGKATPQFAYTHTYSDVLLCDLSIYTNLQNHLNKFVMLYKIMEKKDDVIPPLKHV